MKKPSTPSCDASFSARLIAWQKAHGRHHLPWQQVRDAYPIWLSEIMLQQTQVSAVIPYFQRFMERFPDVNTLAQAPVEAVLEHWSGLGYYARARNLHRCAHAVVAQHGGHFPAQPEQLAALPGIGRSTAAAIAVFAYGVRAAILDGNVKRVFARHFGIAGFPGALAVERALWTLAESLLPADGVEAYTQGLMDLGATVCTRASPACAACPLGDSCVARQQGRVAELPEARPRKAMPEREVTLLLLCDGASVLLERRPPRGIWGGLLSLPEQESALEALEEVLAARFACRLLAERELPAFRHTFTHFHLEIRVIVCTVERLKGAACEASALVWKPLAEAAEAGVPAPIRKILLNYRS